MTHEASAVNTIVVPLDGSENAERALPQALRLASLQRCRLLLFCAAEAAGAEGFRAFASAEGVSVAAAGEVYLNQLAESLPDGIAIDTHVSSVTDVPEMIVELSERVDVTMVVMSRHGATGPGRWLLGSVTDKIVRAAHCPILVVPT